MSVYKYLGMAGVVLIFAWAIFCLICNLAQDRLVQKWKAKEKGWVEEGVRGFGARLIKENRPTKEFEDAFNNRPMKKYSWMHAFLFVGLILIMFANLLKAL